MNNTEKKVRMGMAVFGLIGISLCVAMFKSSLFGADPYQSFVSGLDASISWLGFGTLYAISSAVLLVLMLLFGRKYIGIITVINLFFLGYMVEGGEWLLWTLFGDPGFALRVIYLVVGTVALCFFAAVYITADMGTATYDAMALIMADKGFAKFKYCRIFTDVLCMVLGYFLGATVGVGTIITAFFMGPLIDSFRTKVSDPFLARYQIKD